LSFFTVAALIEWGQQGRAKLAAAGARHAEIKGDGAALQGAIVETVRLILNQAFQVSLTFGDTKAGQQRP